MTNLNCRPLVALGAINNIYLFSAQVQPPEIDSRPLLHFRRLVAPVGPEFSLEFQIQINESSLLETQPSETLHALSASASGGLETDIDIPKLEVGLEWLPLRPTSHLFSADERPFIRLPIGL